MSLDVYLIAESPPTSPQGGSGIFVRRNGQTVEISREEWGRAYRVHNPQNGWGNYDNLVAFTQQYLDACKRFPLARVRVSR